MTGANDLARMVPGFDFLQGLLKNASAGLPHIGQWVAPTLNPEELDKRISELKTVQFWLEQNAKLLATTIQALEVQRMTLSTLQTMNVPLADISNALKIKPAFSAPEPAAPEPAAAAPAEPPPPPPAVDPLQWWGALTQQFTELATKAVQDSAADATKHMAGAMVKQSIDTASGVFKKAAQAATDVAKAAAGSAVGVATAATAASAVPGARKRAAAKAPALVRPRVRKTPPKTAAAKKR